MLIFKMLASGFAKIGKNNVLRAELLDRMQTLNTAQKALLPDALTALTELEARLTEIPWEYETL